jgi:hypothetical protein
MDTQPVRRLCGWIWRNPSTVGSVLIGAVLFFIPASMLWDRSPAGETHLWIDPPVVAPGQHFQAVWTYHVLRPNCVGRVHPVLEDSAHQVFAFASVDSVVHGPVGTTGTYHSNWRAPNGIAPGPVTMRRYTDRGCNPLQFWLWPMKEVHEAKFTVALAPR